MQGHHQPKLGLLRHNLSNKASCALPQIPDKIYFTIGEASKLCLLEPYVLRYWEQEFPQLNPAKRRGNRRYYKCDEILLIRHIKTLLYEQGFTIEGARMKLASERKTLEPCDIQSSELLKSVIAQLQDVLVELNSK